MNQLTHNMTTDCSLNYEFSTRKIQVQNMLCTKIVFCFDIQNNICTQHVLNLYFSCNSMNNLSSYCGLTDSRMRASDTDLPVHIKVPMYFHIRKLMNFQNIKNNFTFFLDIDDIVP